MAVIMHPAETTPAKIADRARGVGIPNKNAPIAPVHAPVPGRGIPTKAANDTHCFSSEPTPSPAAFFSARFKIGLIRFFKDSFFSKNSKGIMGIMFPATQIGRTCWIGNPIQTPTGIAPRSSTTGIAEIAVRTAHLGSPKLMKKLAIFCPVCRCSTASFLAATAGLLVKSVRVTSATAERLKIFERDADLLLFNSTVPSSWIFFLFPKAFPKDGKDRFKLLLVAGEVKGTFFDKPEFPRKTTFKLVVGWNAIDLPLKVTASTSMYGRILLGIIIIKILSIDLGVLMDL
mmetsp:Transcript_5586/g.13979  ORF Transcript_5586/g.13979 Transcript_5586/m.13979 type:complete len:288 (-) Transcript_5586:150-1013(-)